MILMSTAPQPTLPQPVRIDPTKPVSVTIDYFVPVVTRAHLGGTPDDVFNQSPDPIEAPYTPCTPEKCGTLPNEIYRNNPILEVDGSPRMRQLSKHFEDAPKGPVSAGSLWAIIGGATAGTLGVLGGALMGSPILGGVIGAVVGGVGAGAVGAYVNRGDRIRLVYDVHPIIDTKYVGFKEEIVPATQLGEKGYQHRFKPELRETKIGEYKVPRIEHYRETP